MDYREFMSHAPEDCKPTVVDNKRDYELAKEAVARELGKKVEDLTREEKDMAYGRLGLCDLDFP